MTLTRTKDESLIMSFMRGPGIIRRCTGGFDRPANQSELIANDKNTFLIAQDGDVKAGFVCLFPISETGYAIHLCLRTVGQKTKEIVKMAFEYAKTFLGAESIYAIYPQSARAVAKLCQYFGFVNDEEIPYLISVKPPEPYFFERLDLI